MRWLVGAVVAASIQAVCPEARAFCRTTTACNSISPEQTCLPRESCENSENQLFWRGRCMSFGVDHEGSPKRGISFDVALATISEAYRAWTTVDCGGGRTPSLQIFESPRPIRCDHQEYNPDDGNANAWVFYDADWPHDTVQLALTTLSFTAAGEIYDVDVEVNTDVHDIVVEPQPGQDDLLSVCTHEAGHFFGLSHSTVVGSTMNDAYRPDTSMRSLEADDISGLCSVYPPEREADACESTRTPRHGFSPECGDGIPDNPHVTEDNAGCCATAPGRSSGNAWLLPAMVCAGLALMRLRARAR